VLRRTRVRIHSGEFIHIIKAKCITAPYMSNTGP
jgi:hypothetical protein